MTEPQETQQEKETRWAAQRVVSLADADKYCGPLPSRLPGVYQPFMSSCIEFSVPPSTLVARLQAHWSDSTPCSSSCPTS